MNKRRIMNAEFQTALAIVLILLLTLIPILLYGQLAHGAAAPASAFSAFVFDARTGVGIAGSSVIGTPEDGSAAIVALQTDAEGMANFGELAPGNWRFSACQQSIVYGSTSGHTAGTWLVACHRLWLPLVGRGRPDSSETARVNWSEERP